MTDTGYISNVQQITTLVANSLLFRMISHVVSDATGKLNFTNIWKKSASPVVLMIKFSPRWTQVTEPDSFRVAFDERISMSIARAALSGTGGVWGRFRRWSRENGRPRTPLGRPLPPSIRQGSGSGGGTRTDEMAPAGSGGGTRPKLGEASRNCERWR